MSKFYQLTMFNSYYMMISSFNFYLSTFLLVLMCILLDYGVQRIFLICGIVKDPLKINVIDYEPQNKFMRDNKDKKQMKNKCKILIY
jgi:hypothetical protein